MTTLDLSPTTSVDVPVRTEPLNRRLRVLFNGRFIADTTAAIYVFEQGHLPVYYLPKADVDASVLRQTQTTTHSPRKGDAVYWSVEVDGKVATDAVWGYTEPLENVMELADYVGFYWDRMDAWFEEDEEDEEVDITVDGVLQQRPQTHWS